LRNYVLFTCKTHLLEQLKEVEPNVFISAHVHKTRIDIIKDETLKQKIVSAEQRIRNILLEPNGVFSVYFNDRKLCIQFGGVTATIRPRYDDEIAADLKSFLDNEQYLIPLVNDIRVPFSEAEATSYLKYSLLIVEVRASVDIKIEEPNAAIMVTYH